MDTKQPLEAYHEQVVNGKVYKRIYYSPNISIDGKPGGVTREDFIRKTANKKLTVGQMQEISREMHLKRVEKDGQDTVKETWYKEYEKNVGQPHKDVARRDTQVKKAKRMAAAKKKLERFGVEVKF
jgi:hypothetical protein